MCVAARNCDRDWWYLHNRAGSEILILWSPLAIQSTSVERSPVFMWRAVGCKNELMLVSSWLIKLLIDWVLDLLIAWVTELLICGVPLLLLMYWTRVLLCAVDYTVTHVHLILAFEWMSSQCLTFYLFIAASWKNSHPEISKHRTNHSAMLVESLGLFWPSEKTCSYLCYGFGQLYPSTLMAICGARGHHCPSASEGSFVFWRPR